MITKAKEAPIYLSNRHFIRLIESINMGVFGLMRMKSIGGRSNVLRIIDDFMTYFLVFILSKKRRVYKYTKPFASTWYGPNGLLDSKNNTSD